MPTYTNNPWKYDIPSWRKPTTGERVVFIVAGTIWIVFILFRSAFVICLCVAVMIALAYGLSGALHLGWF